MRRKRILLSVLSILFHCVRVPSTIEYTSDFISASMVICTNTYLNCLIPFIGCCYDPRVTTLLINHSELFRVEVDWRAVQYNTWVDIVSIIISIITLIWVRITLVDKLKRGWTTFQDYMVFPNRSTNTVCYFINRLFYFRFTGNIFIFNDSVPRLSLSKFPIAFFSFENHHVPLIVQVNRSSIYLNTSLKVLTCNFLFVRSTSLQDSIIIHLYD